MGNHYITGEEIFPQWFIDQRDRQSEGKIEDPPDHEFFPDDFSGEDFDDDDDDDEDDLWNENFPEDDEDDDLWLEPGFLEQSGNQ